MIRCPSCGFENFKEGIPCPSCGTRVDSIADHATVQQSVLGVARPVPADPAVPFSPGHTFADRYRIDKLLGRGGMGSVYRVHDMKEKTQRALKVLHEGITDADGAERFRREYEILSHLNHPSIPKIYDWGKQGTQLYFVAEYIEGQDLRTGMGLRGTWPPEEAADLIATVAEALARAHERKIVHRDIKPQNILLTDDGYVKLLDFGVAYARGYGMRTLTRTGMTLGTPEYMSPEQFKDSKVEPSSDIYSLGVILYQMLTGGLPFGGNRMEIAIRIMTEWVTPARVARSAVPVWLDHVVMKCLQKDSKKRFPTAAELAVELRRKREPGRPLMTWLPGGDSVMEDPAGQWEWDLVLSSSKQKTNWENGVALRFQETLYKLRETVLPDEKVSRWIYRFSYWPSGEIVRRLIDYEKDRSSSA